MKTKTKPTIETEPVPVPPAGADETAQEEETADGVTLAELQAELEQLKETIRLNNEAQRDPVASIDAGAGAASGPQLTKETLAKMKPAEIAELDWGDVKRVLAS
jgi:hypothetical protein